MTSAMQHDDELPASVAAPAELSLFARSVRVLVVVPQRSVAEVLAARCAAEPDLQVVGIAGTVESAETLVGARRPDVAVVDLDAGAPLDAGFVTRLKQASRSLRVVVLLAELEHALAVECVRAGASAIVSTRSELDVLLTAVRGAANGESHIPPDMLTVVLRALEDSTIRPSPDQERLHRLTSRELEVLELMVDGLDRASIARQLLLSVNTVRTHTKNILAKLEVHSSLEAVSVALRAGLRPRARQVSA